MNTFKTFILMFALTLLLLFVGRTIAGPRGMVYAFVFAGLINFVSYWFSDKIVLKLYRAKEASESQVPQLYSAVRRLTYSAGLPMPKVCVMESPAPNAFATGRNPENAAVVVSRGLLTLLNEDELEAVAAHELAHVKNRDILTSTIAAAIAGAIFMLARMAQWGAIFGGYGGRSSNNRGGGLAGVLAIAIVAPITAMIIQMAISRSREYQADAAGAKMSGKPLALAGALKKISESVKGKNTSISSNPATAHMFIVNPLKGKGIAVLFSTHPALEERVKRLEQINTEIKGYNVPKVVY